MEYKPLTKKNNYPVDIFPNICQGDLEKINRILLKEMHFPLDRLSAYIAREIIANRIVEEQSAIALLKLCLTTEYCCDQEHGCKKCGSCPEYLFELYEQGENNQYCVKCIIDKIFLINKGDTDVY